MNNNIEETTMDNTDQNDEGGETQIPITRRSIVLTMAAGVGGSTISTPAQAQESGNVDVSVSDAYGGSTDGKPIRLEIDQDSQFKIETPALTEGTIIMVGLYARPHGGTYEKMGDAAFQETGRTEPYVIEGADYPAAARNLFNHGDISPQMFEVDKTLSELENPNNRYTEQKIDVKIVAKPRNGEPFTQQDQTFTVHYAQTAGLGVNLGYSLGRKWPVDGSSGDHPDFESKVSGS